MTHIINKEPLFDIEEINTNLNRLKLLVNPATKCICISTYKRVNRTILFESESDEAAAGSDLIVGIFESDPRSTANYHIFLVTESLSDEVIDFIHGTNIRVVTCDAKQLLQRMLKRGAAAPEAVWDLKIYERCVNLGKVNINYQIKEQRNFSRCFKQTLKDRWETPLHIQSMCGCYGVEHRLTRSPTNRLYMAGLELATWASIYFGQCKHAEEQGLLSHMVDTEMPWVITNALFEHNGVRIDEVLRGKIAAAYAMHWPKIETELKNKGLHNIASETTVIACLSKYGLLPLFSKGKNYDVSKDALKPKIHHHPIIKDIYEGS